MPWTAVIHNCIEILIKRCCASAAKGKKIAANSHTLAKPLPEGVVLTDMMKGEWKVGKPIGSGGFGLLYLGELILTDDADYFLVLRLVTSVAVVAWCGG